MDASRRPSEWRRRRLSKSPKEFCDQNFRRKCRRSPLSWWASSRRHLTFLATVTIIFILVDCAADARGDTDVIMAKPHMSDDDEYFPFTECDHIFDSSGESHGQFSFPMIPTVGGGGGGGSATSLLSADGGDELEEGEKDGEADDEATERDVDHLLSRKYFLDRADLSSRAIGGASKNLPNNIQCIYTFIAKPGQRVKLEFNHFQLTGTADSCDLEYVDIYSELESPHEDLIAAAFGGRYCGTVAPHVRISLHNVLILVFHSRVGKKRAGGVRIDGTYQFISESRYIPGSRLPGKCAFLIEPKKKRQGSILSPTYPGTYPNNFYCIYLLKGGADERIRLYFRDFDIYFGGEHCPYDSLTVYDGPTNAAPILRKVCGLQQRLEMFSFGPTLLLEFNTSEPVKNDPRGFVIDYEFSDRFVDVNRLIRGQRGVSHVLGTECDIRILSNRESVHYIESANYPNLYPLNTTCTYILDGLQGDQNLEKVILTFETLSMADAERTHSAQPHGALSSAGMDADDCASGSFVGVALTADSIKTVLSPTDESVYDVILCGRIPRGSTDLGPYTSMGPRIVVVFGSVDSAAPLKRSQTYGFRAKVEFKTDFGVPGEAMGDSNRCMFQFKNKLGSFNSPRYPANYPLDTNCTYLIVGEPGEQILLYFTQFALFEENTKRQCNDFLEIYDIFREPDGKERTQFQAKHCWTMFPGPTVSTFGAHEMRVVFSSDSFGTANGFNAMYEIRKSRLEDVPSKAKSDSRHCGQLIESSEEVTTGFFTSPGFPVKYNKDQHCDWEIRVRPGHQILLQLTKMEVEGEMTDQKTSCMNAVIVIHLDYRNRSADLAICGTNAAVLAPIVTRNNSIRISFLTAPEKVNGLNGFNFTWTEIRMVESDSECADETHYLCSYTRLCIAASLRCNGDENCGQNDDTDEAHCNIAEKVTDMRTILIAALFSGFIFLFIFTFFCFLFKKKLERKKQRKRRRRNTGCGKAAIAVNGNAQCGGGGTLADGGGGGGGGVSAAAVGGGATSQRPRSNQSQHQNARNHHHHNHNNNHHHKHSGAGSSGSGGGSGGGGGDQHHRRQPPHAPPRRQPFRSPQPIGFSPAATATRTGSTTSGDDDGGGGGAFRFGSAALSSPSPGALRGRLTPIALLGAPSPHAVVAAANFGSANNVNVYMISTANSPLMGLRPCEATRRSAGDLAASPPACPHRPPPPRFLVPVGASVDAAPARVGAGGCATSGDDEPIPVAEVNPAFLSGMYGGDSAKFGALNVSSAQDSEGQRVFFG